MVFSLIQNYIFTIMLILYFKNISLSMEIFLWIKEPIKITYMFMNK
jgi:hypothetical protein